MKLVLTLIIGLVFSANNQEEQLINQGGSDTATMQSAASTSTPAGVSGTVGYQASWISRQLTQDTDDNTVLGLGGQDDPFSSVVIADYDKGYLDIPNWFQIEDLDVNTAFEIQFTESAWGVPSNYSGKKSNDQTIEDNELYINIDVFDGGLQNSDSHAVTSGASLAGEDGNYTTEITNGGFFNTTVPTAGTNPVYDGAVDDMTKHGTGTDDLIPLQTITSCGGYISDGSSAGMKDGSSGNAYFTTDNTVYCSNIDSNTPTSLLFGGNNALIGTESIHTGNNTTITTHYASTANGGVAATSASTLYTVTASATDVVNTGNTADITRHGVENAKFDLDARVLMDWVSDVPGTYTKSITMTLVILE